MVELRTERKRRGWSQTRLSAMTGIAQSDISAIENGRRLPGAGWRRRIAGALDVPEDSIFPQRDAERQGVGA